MTFSRVSNNMTVEASCQDFRTGEPFPIEKSDMYQEWRAEQIEIQRLKWILSERAGYDVGDFHTQWVWWTAYSRSWKEAYRTSGVR